MMRGVFALSVASYSRGFSFSYMNIIFGLHKIKLCRYFLSVNGSTFFTQLSGNAVYDDTEPVLPYIFKVWRSEESPCRP
jgi:hypothetical protein